MSYLVESYSPDPTSSGASVAQRVRQVPRRQGDPVVRYRGSIAVPGDEVTFHLFDAAHASAVVELCVGAGIACDRIVVAVPFDDTEQG